MPDIVERLRSHPSRDTRALLDEAASEIQMLRTHRDALIVRCKKLEARLEAECYGDR